MILDGKALSKKRKDPFVNLERASKKGGCDVNVQ